MAAGSIIIDLLMNTGSFETDTQRATKSLKALKNGLYEVSTEAGTVTAKFDSLFNVYRKVETAQNGITSAAQKSQSAFRSSNQIIQNSSYQLTDFIVQVSGGTSALRAFSQQAPQFLGAFGGAGAILGIFAAIGGAAADLIVKMSGVKEVSDVMKQFDDVLGGVTSTARTFDMTNVIKQFNASDAATRESIVQLLSYKKALIEVTNIDLRKAFAGQVADLTDTGFINQFKSGMPSELFASKMGIDVNKEMYADLRVLRYEYGSVQAFADKYATTLVKGNEEGRKFAKTIIEMAQSLKEGEMATKAINEAQSKMSKAGATGAIPIPGAKTKATGTSDADRLAKQELASADKFADALERQTQQLAFQQTLIGRNAQEVELLNAQYRVQAELEKTIQDMQRQGIDITQASMDKMNEAAANAIAKQQEIINSKFARQQDPMAGIGDALSAYANQANNIALGMQNVFTNAFKNMEDGIVKFAMTGKFAFGDFANAVISDLMRIYVRMALMKLVEAGMGAFIGGGMSASTQASAYGGAGQQFSNTSGTISSWGSMKYADGGYTGDGGKYQPAGIVHAGEFVMSKEATNRIGVGTLNRMLKGYASGGYVGSDSMPMANNAGININVKNEAGAAGYEAVASAKKNENGIDVEILVRKVMANDLRNNGPMAQQMTNTFGLRRAM